MRHFIVLGFSSSSQMDSGKQLHLGSDRGAAIAAVNTPDKKYIRKELFELAVPDMRRHFPAETKAAEAKDK
jgi:hypothetical protein